MPKPERHVFICMQGRPPGHPRGSCQQNGCTDVFDEFLFQLQQRNCYDKIAITNTGCIGPCGNGPNVLVYPEGVFYGAMTKDDVAEIFEEHLLGGKPVERLRVPEEVWG
jgi:(2Fe-2S) ferredoxin